MKFHKLLPSLLVAGIAFSSAVSITSCKKDDNNSTTPYVNPRILTGDVTTNKTLTADSAWTLKGYVYVKSGATLTIPAGTIVKSDIVDKGAIIVEPGGKIMAEGTATQPVVFTSGLPKGQRRPGDWGGIILLGNAPTNRSTPPTIEGGVNRTYGGTNPTDNSGVLKYVRIEFAGIAAAPGSEINGLTLGGVGSGTTIENVMVSFGNDDAFEFFGGTVNCKNLIAFSCLDDDFDFDFGYTGKLQFGISVKHPQYADQGDASNGIECDNDGTGTTATPNTRPVISNFTFIGPNGRANTQANHNFANRWRRASQFVIRNSIMIGHQKGGFSIESNETAASYTGGTSEFKNNLVHAIADPFKSSVSTLTAAAMETKALSEGCVKLAAAADAKLTAPFALYSDATPGNPNLLPASGSPALSGSSFTGLDAFFTSTTYVGAMGTTDWTSGWANWNPNGTDY